MHIAVWFNACSVIKLFCSFILWIGLLDWQDILFLITFLQKFDNEDGIGLAVPNLSGPAEGLLAM